VVDAKRVIATRALTRAGQPGTRKAAVGAKEPSNKVKDANVKKSKPVKAKQQKTKAAVRGHNLRQTSPSPVEDDIEEEYDTEEECEEEVDTDPEEDEAIALSQEKSKRTRRPKKKPGFVLIKGVTKWRSIKRDYDTITFEAIAEEERKTARAKVQMKKKMIAHESAKL